MVIRTVSTWCLKNVKKLIYVVVLIEIYGMLVAVILFYNNFCGDFEKN